MNKVGIFLKNNKTSILTVASVAGVFGTAVLTARGQMKADEILSDYYAVEILPDAVEEDDPEEKELVPNLFVTDERSFDFRSFCSRRRNHRGFHL